MAQAHVARSIGVSESCVCKIETGVNPSLSRRKWKRVADVLGADQEAIRVYTALSGISVRRHLTAGEIRAMAGFLLERVKNAQWDAEKMEQDWEAGG